MKMVRPARLGSYLIILREGVARISVWNMTKISENDQFHFFNQVFAYRFLYDDHDPTDIILESQQGYIAPTQNPYMPDCLD